MKIYVRPPVIAEHDGLRDMVLGGVLGGVHDGERKRLNAWALRSPNANSHRVSRGDNGRLVVALTKFAWMSLPSQTLNLNGK